MQQILYNFRLSTNTSQMKRRLTIQISGIHKILQTYNRLLGIPRRRNKPIIRTHDTITHKRHNTHRTLIRRPMQRTISTIIHLKRIRTLLHQIGNQIIRPIPCCNQQRRRTIPITHRQLLPHSLLTTHTSITITITISSSMMQQTAHIGNQTITRSPMNRPHTQMILRCHTNLTLHLQQKFDKSYIILTFGSPMHQSTFGIIVHVKFPQNKHFIGILLR
mmetsp:Transcript_7019/g.9108  ORF Transcript_7019/g.9108 Transcript_7019/m.9108 type:complete len:219 (+) Transcript_7019:1347-2003(+)